MYKVYVTINDRFEIYVTVIQNGHLENESDRVGLQLALWFITYEPRHEISNNVLSATSKTSDQPAHTRNLIKVFATHLNIL